MIKLVVFHEKHGDNYYSYETQEELYEIALYVLKKRVEFWGKGYLEEDSSISSIIQNNDGKRAWSFINRRQHWEYEDFSLEDAMTEKDLREIKNG